MKREQAEQIAQKHANAGGSYYEMLTDRCVDAILEAVAIEREACAKPLDEAAARLLAPKRTNEVDRHVASVLQEHAKAIRAMGE